MRAAQNGMFERGGGRYPLLPLPRFLEILCRQTRQFDDTCLAFRVSPTFTLILALVIDPGLIGGGLFLIGLCLAKITICR